MVRPWDPLVNQHNSETLIHKSLVVFIQTTMSAVKAMFNGRRMTRHWTKIMVRVLITHFGPLVTRPLYIFKDRLEADTAAIALSSASSLTLYHLEKEISFKKTLTIAARSRRRTTLLQPSIRRNYRRTRPQLPETVKGYVYESGRITTRTLMFQLKSTHLKYNKRRIPEVKIDAFFNAPRDALVSHSFIKYRGSEFLVYGFTHPSFEVNHVIKSVGDVDWKGDVVVFQVGVVKPLLRSPAFKRDTVDRVASKFVTSILNKTAGAEATQED
ncbi:hypothetical protein NMY22_g7764 [Coprinellus aureogranulatus]|nr:hypothetical protein NMY22_g7764 [Coprinellus aureogranulatus]